jgi:hypothetical protein
MKKIACIGTREISEEMRRKLSLFGKMIVMRGYELHTGNALGSDAAFAEGGNKLPGQVHLHLPWSSYNAGLINPSNVVHTSYSSALAELAAGCHPAWNACSQGTKKMLTRNASIVSVADIVVYHVDESKLGGGGTGHGVRIACNLKKPQLAITVDSTIEQIYEAFFKIE